MKVWDGAEFSQIAPIGFGAAGADVTPVTATNPLPMEFKPSVSGATALTGTANSTSVVGPFTPVLGRPIWLLLSGTWAGTVTLKRSVDGGTTKLPLTVGGSSWGVFTGNVCEQIVEPSESGETYYLDFTYVSGTLAYRMAQ